MSQETGAVTTKDEGATLAMVLGEKKPKA